MRSWLFAILHNLHRETLRRDARAADNRTMPAAEASGPEQEVGLTVRDLQKALDRLHPEHREVILMIGVGELSYQQAADILDIPIGTVMSRLARGRARLRELMEGDDKPALRRVK